jgi:ArsR family transcriptional regulator
MNYENVSSEKKVLRGARCLKILGHPVRIQLLGLLREGERSVSSLAQDLGVSQSNLSQHLSLLKDKGIIDCRREGHQVFYSLADSRIPEFFVLMEEIFCR